MDEGDAHHAGAVPSPDGEPADGAAVEPAPRSRGRRVRRTTAGLVALVLALAGAAYWLDLGDSLGTAAPDPLTEPAQVEPPEGLTLPTARTAPEVAAPLRAGTPTRPAVRRAVAGLLGDRRLGPRVALVVAGLDGRPVFERGVDVVTPASTMKLLTSLAALEALGPEHRFSTRAVLSGRRLVLVGGGDPLLARQASADDPFPEVADVGTLARLTARELTDRGRTRVRLGYDVSLFGGPRVNPHWEPDYVSDQVVSPVVPLWVDEGREQAGAPARSDDPAAAAASAFAAELRRRGITVQGRPAPATLPEGADPVASVAGAELVEVVQHVLETSDNEAAEVLARHVAVAEGEAATFAGASRAVRAVLRRLGVDMRGAVLRDGSGLARGNRLRTETLLDVLAVSADPRRPELSGVVGGLPVAGFTGSLAYRFDVRADPGLGWVRAKTGTLTGVHALAGTVVGRDGTVMTYLALADRVKVENTLFVRARLDQVSAALAACACGRGG